MPLKVLAVDDSPTMRDMLKRALDGAGIELYLAKDGMHGLELLAAAQPDAIISDLNMPRLDGFGFIAAVRAQDRYRATPILVLTTQSAPEFKARARAAGASGWIGKPFEPGKLVQALTLVAG